MMKSIIFITLGSLLISLSSCHHHDLHIVVNNGSYHVDIERTGQVEFTADTNAIKRISQNGYLSYEKNEKRMRAEYDEKAGVYMEIYDNGEKMPLDSAGKAFLAEAVRDMAARHVGPVIREN